MVALPPSYQDSLDDYSARLRRRFGDRVRFVRLFGSWARGEATADSDIDVAAVIEGLTRDEWRAALSLAAEVELDGGEPLSVFAVSGERFDELLSRERRIAQDILAEGVPL